MPSLVTLSMKVQSVWNGLWPRPESHVSALKPRRTSPELCIWSRIVPGPRPLLSVGGDEPLVHAASIFNSAAASPALISRNGRRVQLLSWRTPSGSQISLAIPRRDSYGRSR